LCWGGGGWPNQALQATAAAPGSFTFAFSHNAVVADVSASPAAVPELDRSATGVRTY
jgi:hypothetical protein